MKVHPLIRPFIFEREKYSGVAELRASLEHEKLVAATCLGVDTLAVIRSMAFDYCIIDEASQLSVPACLGPLQFAQKFVLVGDNYQMNPLFRSITAQEESDLSLFRRLAEAHPHAVTSLSTQYRMSSDIMSLCNHLIYDGKLRPGNYEVATQSLKIQDAELSARLLAEFFVGQSAGDLAKAILNPKVIFLDTSQFCPLETRTGNNIQNATEAQIVTKIINCMLKGGVPQYAIGVLSPYRSQLRLLKTELSHHDGIELYTVDQSQGREKECIFISFVRSNTKGNIGELLNDWKRVNVAFSRAKAKLVMVGCRRTLQSAYVFQQFFELIEERGWVVRMESLPRGCGGVGA
ncbi:Tripartite DNA replication factor [Phlyctochytrium bullatum]|nr:Tripartite DNA replication factor [Phlyctochytrium bullatum]